MNARGLCRRVVGAVASFPMGSGMLGGPRCAGLCDEWWRCAANCGGFRGSNGSMLRCAAKCGEVGDPKCVIWGDLVAKAAEQMRLAGWQPQRLVALSEEPLRLRRGMGKVV